MVLVKVPIMKGYSSRDIARARYNFAIEERRLKGILKSISELGIVVSIGLAIILVYFI